MVKQNFETTLDKFESELWQFHVKVPTSIVENFSKINKKRFICRMNDSVDLHCAFIPAGEGQYFINVNKEIRKALNLKLGESVKCSIIADESKYGMPIAEEMVEVLETDEEGSKLFHDLTPGKQRSLIYLVSKPKSSDKRIEKAIILLNHLRANNGLLDFKLLNDAFKQGLH